MKNPNQCPLTYRAALLCQGVMEYRRGHLAPVLKWVQERTAGMIPGSYRVTITPVDYLLPWERENG